MSLVRRRVIATGRVQGVFFRESTRRRAAALGAAGWVRNLPDGNVEAVIEAPAPVVEALLEYIRQGPGAARVLATEVREEAPENLAGFTIR